MKVLYKFFKIFRGSSAVERSPVLQVRGIIYLCIPTRRNEWKNELMPTVENIWSWLLVEEEKDFVRWPESIKAVSVLYVAIRSAREL